MAAGEIEPGSPTLKPSALALSYGEGTRLSEMAYERPKYNRRLRLQSAAAAFGRACLFS